MPSYKQYFILCILYLVCSGYSLAVNAASALHAEPLMQLQGELDQPTGVALSDDGHAYVLDGLNGRIVVFDATGQQAFSFDEQQKLELPMGIAVAGKRIYIADTGNQRIVIYDLRGRFIKSFSLVAKFPPKPVALNVSDGVISWSDRRNHQVCQHEAETGKQLRCWGKRGEGKNEFQFPFQLAMDRDAYLHVVDILNGRIQVFNPQGRRFIQTGRFGLEPGELYRPNGLAFTGKDELLVSDTYRGTISVYHKGRFVAYLRDPQGSPLQLDTPTSLAVWRDRLYVVNTIKNRLEVFRLSYKKVKQTAQQNKPQAAAQKSCISCHLGWADNYPTGEGEQDGVPPVATPRMCYSCHHGAVVDSRQAIGRGEQHPDIHHQRKKEATAKPDKEREDEIPEAFPLLAAQHGNKKQLSCGSCHTPHQENTDNADTLNAEHTNPWLRVLNSDGELCQQCHESKLDSSTNKRHPLRGVNHPVGIYLSPPPTPDAQGFATNKKLHEGLPTALLDKGASLNNQQQLICQSCHQIHGSSETSLTVLPFDNGELCKQCHPRQHAGDKKEARKKGVHPVNIKLEKPIKMGDEKIKRVTCLSCHSLHAGKEGTPLLKYEYRNGKLCSFCHKEFDAVLNSDHDLRITAKKSKNRFADTPEQAGLCGSCHTLHRGEAKMPFLYAGKQHDYSGKQAIQARDKLCLACHRKKGLAEKARVEHFSHPSIDLVLRSNPADMPLTDKQNNTKEFGAIACITCHDPHRWAPKTNSQLQALPRDIKPKNRDGNVLDSFLRRKGPKGSFCIDCHGLETPVKYKYYHDKFSRDKGADYIK